MKIRVIKYALPMLLFFGAWRSFSHTGIIVWIPVIASFMIIPLLELVVKPNPANLDGEEEEMAKQDRLYDWLLYLVVPMQYYTLYQFLVTMQDSSMAAIDRAGMTLTMGLVCGIMGINVGHELGHRVNKTEQTLARMLLLTSLYMHFFIEHNRGHHKYVGTPEDASTAHRNEPLYFFWLRSVSGVYIKAWKIAGDEQRKKGKSFLQNEMLHYQLIEVTFCMFIGFYFGWMVLAYFFVAAVLGMLLLETVNYIEHYGLMRKPLGDGKYERAMPEHSWNSNHNIGRVMLFELARHSDHHYLASRKYQLLRHHDGSPQLPTGYPGSMLLAMVPPIWFRVMNRKIDRSANE